MKRKHFLILIVVVLMTGLLAGCKNEADETTAQNSLFEEASSEHDIIQDKEISTGTEEISEENDAQQAETSYEMPDWLAAYVDYIKGMEDGNPYWGCTFLYVDDDEIPELLMNTYEKENACIGLTFYNGELDTLQIGGLRCRYIEKKNLLCATSGQAGEYANQVYSIENGKWIHVAGGKYISEVKDGLHIDKYSFEWEGVKVEEELYWERLHHVFDEELAVVPGKYYTFNDMLDQIKAGTFVLETPVEQDTDEYKGEVIVDFEYSDEYIPISKVDFASYKNELSAEDWQALSSFFPVLLEGKTFMAAFCPRPNKYTDDFEEYCINNLYASWHSEYPDEFVLDEFALCDLTGDGQRELIVHSEWSEDLFCVFHKEGDNFYAVYMPIRWFEELQKNGIYVGSGGAGTNYYRRLHFLRDVFWEEEIAMYDWDRYYKINGEDVSEAEIMAWEAEMMVGEAVWYDVRAIKP